MKKNKKLSLAQLFANNKFVQVFALVVAAFFWLIVAMTGNFTTTRTIYGVPVKIDSASNALTSIGLHAIEDENIRVNVEVEGLRHIVGQLKPEDFTLTTRLAGVTEAATYDLTPVSADVAPNQDYEIIAYSPEKVRVKFDRISRKAFKVEPHITGLEIAPGYIEKTTAASPDMINIEGPETEIEKIASCAVVAELASPLDRSFSADFPILLYDASGNLLDPEELHLNMDRTEAQLTIQVLKTTNLPLQVDYINVPRSFPKDELLERTKISHLDVTLAGPFDLIDRLTEIQLESINLKTVTLERSIFSFDVPLPSPSDQFMQLDNVTSVVVELDDTGLESAVFNVANPRLINVPPGFEVKLLADTIYNVEFIGKKEILETMTSDDIVAEVDLSEREIVSGSYTIPVKISVPGRGLVWATGDHGVTIEATRIM